MLPINCKCQRLSQALRWAEENGWGECGTPVGKARANQLANGEPITRDTIARMAGFERHRQNSQKELGDGCGRLMWLAWGGDAGIEWAQRKLEQIDRQKMQSFSVVNNEERIVVGPAMIPDMPIFRSDSTGEYFVFFDKKTIETIALKFYAKQGTQRYIQFLSTATTAYWANFDLQDGLAYAGGTTSSVSIVSVGNGWYRCSLSVTDSNSNQPTIGFVTSLNSARAPSTTLTTNCYLWGAQLEAGSFATSYIPTIASTVTRSADVASVNTLSPWFNATEGTLFAEYNNPYPVAADQYVAVLQDASYVANAISIRNYTTAIINQVWAGSVRQVDIVDGTASANATSKTTFAYQLNNSAASSNGGTAVVDTTCTMPTGILTLNIGNRNGNSEFKNGYIRRIAYYPRRLTNAELQALTS